MPLYIILSSLVCILIFLSWMKKLISKYPEPPTYPGALPIIGHGHILLGNAVDLWETFTQIMSYTLKVGGLAKLLIGPVTLFYVLTDPDDVSTVLNKCLDKPPMYDFAKDWLGNGLVTCKLVQWKKGRKLLSPAFSQRALCQLLDIFNIQSRRLVDNLAVEGGKESFDPYTYIRNNILETVNQTILGLKKEHGDVIDKTYADVSDHLFDIIVERFQKVWLHLPFLYNRSDLKKRQDKVMNNNKTLIFQVIQEQKSELQRMNENNIQNNDFSKKNTTLNYMLENLSNSELSRNDYIREHLETLIIASYDTTATVFTYALKLIGSDQSVQERIFEEIEKIFGSSDRNVEKKDLSQLKYLEAVIKETVRLYPPVPIIARTTQEDVKLKNYTIPKNQAIAIPLYGVHRHSAWGEDAEQFKPERWLTSECQLSSIFFGFSVGRRNCLGEQYGLMVLKIALVHLLRRYCIISDNNKLVLKFNVLLKPISGHHISISLRSQ